MDQLRTRELLVHQRRRVAAVKALGAYSPALEVIDGAIVAPLTNFQTNLPIQKFDGGTYYSNGKICKRSLHIKNSAINSPQENPAPKNAKAGLHLFGGLLKNEHFGHFVAESLSRLWPLALMNNQISSVVFYLRYESSPVPNFVRELIDCIRPELEIQIIHETTSFERLVVPDQIAHPVIGFTAGHPLIKSLFSSFTSQSSPKTEKIYVSRTKLKQNEGAILGEKFLEANLRAEGYRIVHPQELSVAEQLAIYCSAQKLIFAEGSALHLFVLVATKDQDAFIVRRRPMGIVFDWQFESFDLNPLNGTGHIENFFIPERDGTKLNRAQAWLDFESLAQEMCDHGFISQSKWSFPSKNDLSSELRELETSFRQRMIRYDYSDFAILK